MGEGPQLPSRTGTARSRGALEGASAATPSWLLRNGGRAQPPERNEEAYLAYLAHEHKDWDIVESWGYIGGTLGVFACIAWNGLAKHYPLVVFYWAIVNQPLALVPGLVSRCLPALYLRHREPIIMACKLAAAAVYPALRLAWHAPGTPPEVRAIFGSTAWGWLPVHPMSLVQCGAMLMVQLSTRHSLRFRAQLFCQLVLLVSVLQAEMAARRRSPCPHQHLVSAGMATVLQVVCGVLMPLAHHYVLDTKRRRRCAALALQQQRRQL